MSDYVIYNGELYHHGIKGQRWGVRRFQKYDGSLTPKGEKRYELKSARQFKKALNKIDQGIAEEKRSVKSHAKKAARYQTMAELANSHGMTSTRDRYAQKANEQLKEAQTHASNIKKGESLTWKLVGDAASKGYSVNSREITRYTNKGEITAGALLFGVLGTVATMQIGKQEGYRYSVKKTKKGQSPSVSLATKG